MPTYSFGSFQINANSGGLGYFLLGKNVDLPEVAPVTFTIARLGGTKKSGEQIKERNITVTLKVIGTSRLDLMSRLDTLNQALSLRSQSLVIHEDSRYFRSVDALSAPVAFQAGNGIVSMTVAIVFTAYDPFAYAASGSSYDTGTQTLTLTGGLWNFPAINITGGGNTYSYPFIRIYNRTSTGSTTLTANRNSGTAYTTIAVAATTFSGAVGDTVTITHSSTTQTLTVATSFSVGATTITVSSFTASANYVSGDAAAKVTQWTNFSITQSNDNQTLSAVTSTGVPLPSANGDYVDIQCDPAAVNGWSIQTNNSGLFSDPLGLFPVMEPGTTNFTIAIASGSQVSAQCQFSWNARWMS